MTREHKLALVIGFGLILFVGILLSDHLRHESPQNEPLPSASNTLWSMPKSLDPKSPTQLAIPTRYASAANAKKTVISDRTPLSEIRATPDSTSPSTITSVLSWTQTETATPSQARISVIEERPKATPVVNSRTPAPVTHTVQSGETLQEISHAYFGTTRRWKEISNANGLKNGDMLRLGQNLVLPANTRKTIATPNIKSRVQSSPRTYTVQEGDTLSSISRQTLGTNRRWNDIKELNNIEDSKFIKPGDVLSIPRK
jgi:nucleoid-associated protein YgaU